MAAQTSILTVTLNPAVDVATSVPEMIAGPKLRCGPPRFDPGGGGVNVARAICKLGGTAKALIAVGGPMGDRLVNLLAKEAVPTLPVQVSGETRQSFAVTDDSTGDQYRFSVPGQSLATQDADRLLAEISQHAAKDSYLVLSGSVAPGLPAAFQSQIIAAVDAKFVIDTAGAALDRLIAEPVSPVHLLRVDQKEAEEAAGQPMPTVADSVAFAASLVARGVAKTIVTGRGAEGSVLVTAEDRFICHPPIVPVRSKIGAGDAFVGALVLALARGEPSETALRRGVAAASATVETVATALCDPDTVTARFAECDVETI